VTSAVVALDLRKHPDLHDDVDVEFLRQVVRTAFNQRRKMLRKSLRSLVEQTQRPVPETWAEKRPEALAPEEFIELSRHLGPG
jgi:16S rRNA (adenine1518-N6/adenine1519-N6)-dimethyltransferase